MRVVLQRVHFAKVISDGILTGEISAGLVVLLGAHKNDTLQMVDQMADRVLGCRIFNDDQGKINLNVEQISGSLLVVSNFTLCGDAWASRRPSFMAAAGFDQGKEFYDAFVAKLAEKNTPVQTGVFGADMILTMAADGPVTIVIDL